MKNPQKMPQKKPNISPRGPCIIDLITSSEIRDFQAVTAGNTIRSLYRVCAYLLDSSGFRIPSDGIQ
jgi:hypothetical protein